MVEGNGHNSDGASMSRVWRMEAVVFNLEKYFVAVVQCADGRALASLLEHCNQEHVAILQSVMKGQKSTGKPE